MSSRYKLPCDCGESTVVDVRQAGETVRCTCGRALGVPTLRQLRQLEGADDRAARIPTRTWTLQQGLLFASGLLVAAIAAGSSAYLLLRISRLDTNQPDVSSVRFEREIDSFTPPETWLIWKELRQMRLDTRPTPLFVLARRETDWLKRLLWVALGLGAGGLALAASAFLIKPGRRRPT
jgi:hypothetical protein